MEMVSFAIFGLLVALSLGALVLMSTHVAGIVIVVSGLLFVGACFTCDPPGLAWFEASLTWRGDWTSCLWVAALLLPCLFILERARMRKAEKDDDFRHPRFFRLLTQPVFEVLIGAWFLPLALAALLTRCGVSYQGVFSPRADRILQMPLFFGGFTFWSLILMICYWLKHVRYGVTQFLAMSILLYAVQFHGVVVAMIGAIAAYAIIHSVTARPLLWAQR